MDSWEAYAATFDGQEFQWKGLRKTQAIWRYNFLRRGFLWRGHSLKSVGYRKEMDSNAGQ